MLKNGRQPGLLEQYAHLIHKRRGPSFVPRNDTREGTIKRLIRERGFGFIRPEGKISDLFFHRTSLQEANFDSLNEGDRVQFDVQRDERRNQNHAVNIRLLRRA
ncbi:MAG: cold shock domain-containing protein [Chloroflexi bacterium]|nr:cold shock domain-containing protein [Chloroflexota bacterium]